ncbi:MAG TPA: MBL fold metallo-hydrolase [Bacteroidia bacterium]|nr:MBL fold metallo-hydrolase [Bacteroidia bacterium]
MKLHTIDTGFFKLDGGAMFGVVPKSMWQKLNAPDENNMCTWAMRCLLIEDGNKLILIDNGIGNKQDDKFFGHYFLHGDTNLDQSLKAAGFSKDDITDVFLTHLHFDHCGGSIEWNKDKTGFIPAFKNAHFWSNANHWEWATKPNAREKASFLKENILPIQESGQLKLTEDGAEPFAGVKVKYMNGHTDGMMLPHINYKGKTVVFMADLLPSVGHIPLPYVMAYDTRPLLTLSEKAAFLNEAAEKEYILFFEHDPINQCCTLQQTEKGVRLKETFRLEEI